MLRLLGVGVAGTAITAVGLTEAQAERKRGRNVRAQTTAAAVAPIPITGTGADGSLFAGLFTLTRFAVQNGVLVGIGTLTGTLKDVTGAVLGQVNQQIAIPVDLLNTTGTCEILTLVLGPLDLNLLGLIVELEQVELVIRAEQGPGNLLGNLLCAIAGLLDNGGALNRLVGLLNNLLRALG